MKRIELFLFFVLILLFFNSCVKDVTPEFKGYKSHLVVNSLLVPDSIISVHLSLSVRSDNEDNFPDYSDATVEIEDGNHKTGTIYQGNGKYTADSYPVSGETYNLIIKMENGEFLKSETRIPSKPIIKILPIFEKNLLQVNISDNSHEKNYYWVGIKIYDKSSSQSYYETYFYSDFLLFDDFNRTQDGELIEGVRYSYHFYARLDDSNFNGKEISFLTPRKWPEPDDFIDYIFFLYIINADEHLDKYMKSALIQYELGVIGDMPVFHTPIDMYSNIENGKGIFGSYTISQFDITTP